MMAGREISGCSRAKTSLQDKISAKVLLALAAFKKARLEAAAVHSFQALPCFAILRLVSLIVEEKDWVVRNFEVTYLVFLLVCLGRRVKLIVSLRFW